VLLLLQTPIPRNQPKKQVETKLRTQELPDYGYVYVVIKKYVNQGWIQIVHQALA
jgi:hypothetical protein